MNATLLKSNDGNDDSVKRELFGSFKGFSLKPLPMTKPNIIGASNVAYVHPVAKTETNNEQCMPNRAAPLPPASNSPKKTQIKSSPVSHPKSSPTSIRYQNIDSIDKTSPETPIEVKLFATKSDAKERPKISHPVLENSTFSVKELIASANQGPKSTSNVLPKTTTQTSNIAQKASELQSALQKNPSDKSTTKKLEISQPVRPTSFGRSQSMRSPSAKEAPKRNALASGSMRHPGGVKRTGTMNRPKNPPPPRPNNPPSSAGSDSMRNIYANSSEDNIYCDIEEIKEPSPPNGLLSEIVNEIENRNLNSIYSTAKKPTPKNVIEPSNNIDASSTESSTDIQKSGSDNSHIYMNTASAEQPLIHKPSFNVQDSKAKKSNVALIAKKLSSNAIAAGNSSKPMIAVKPPLSGEQKVVNASNKVTSQNNSTKINKISPNATNINATGRPNINPTSNVRSMHKRFENRNA